MDKRVVIIGSTLQMFLIMYTGVGMHILNTEFFGYIMQDEKYKDINEASRKFFQFKLETLGKIYLARGPCTPTSHHTITLPYSFPLFPSPFS